MLTFFKKESKKNQTFELLCGLIKDILPKDLNIELSKETRFEDIGFDSMKFINLLLSLEDISNVNIDKIVAEIDMSNIDTIQDVVSILEKIK
jgi:acyl carrier protein